MQITDIKIRTLFDEGPMKAIVSVILTHTKTASTARCMNIIWQQESRPETSRRPSHASSTTIR